MLFEDESPNIYGDSLTKIRFTDDIHEGSGPDHFGQWF
jgi:hypothetical protein